MSLIKNGIGPVGAAQIAAPLAACAKLREINLFRNQLLDDIFEGNEDTYRTMIKALAAGSSWTGDLEVMDHSQGEKHSPKP